MPPRAAILLPVPPARLLDAADAPAEIVARGKDARQADRLLRLAREAVIGRVGDAAVKPPDEVRAAMPSVPWEGIRANRVLVAHIHHRIDLLAQLTLPSSRAGPA
jgi:uncharacterized protein with HEPN domain